MAHILAGLMSGTSLDGVDGVLVDIETGRPRHLAHVHRPFAEPLRAELLALNHAGTDELARAAIAANALARLCAEVVAALRAQCPDAHVRAIGCHGQTVRHQPADGYTIQLLNGALLAELTGLDVVCDFRSRDVAAGGEGAPLVPAFHQAAFGDPAIHRVVVNIGGIANLTDLPPAGGATGFDCGPGNLLLDAWTQRHRGEPFDRDGAWAAQGHVLPALLARLSAEAFFARTPPKSSGRDLFNTDWLARGLTGNEMPADVQATLLALSADTIADAVTRFCGDATEVFLCGGGARNRTLAAALARRLAPRRLAATDALGINAEQVEATAFAWLAGRTLAAQPGNLPSATGARGPRVLGAIHRA